MTTSSRVCAHSTSGVILRRVTSSFEAHSVCSLMVRLSSCTAVTLGGGLSFRGGVVARSPVGEGGTTSVLATREGGGVAKGREKGSRIRRL